MSAADHATLALLAYAHAVGCGYLARLSEKRHPSVTSWLLCAMFAHVAAGLANSLYSSWIILFVGTRNIR